MRVWTGLVVPSTHGPHVEQVGWGVARQVVRALREQGTDDPLLDVLADLAEQPGHLAYAVFRGREVTAVALARLADRPHDEPHGGAEYVGDVLAPHADPATRGALVVRALHDVGRAGARWLDVAPEVAAGTHLPYPEE